MKITALSNTFFRKPYIPWYVNFKFWYYLGTSKSSTKVYVTTDDFPNLKKCYSLFGIFPKKAQNSYSDIWFPVYYSDNLIELPVEYYAQIYHAQTEEVQTIREQDDFQAYTPVIGYTKSNYPICLYYLETLYTDINYLYTTQEKYEAAKNTYRSKCFLPKKNQVVTYEIQIGLLDSYNEWVDYIPTTEL